MPSLQRLMLPLLLVPSLRLRRLQDVCLLPDNLLQLRVMLLLHDMLLLQELHHVSGLLHVRSVR